MLVKRSPQKANDVAVSQGFKQLDFPMQTSVLPLCSIGVQGIKTDLLHSYQLALAGQATVHLVWKKQTRLPGLVESSVTSTVNSIVCKETKVLFSSLTKAEQQEVLWSTDLKKTLNIACDTIVSKYVISCIMN